MLRQLVLAGGSVTMEALGCQTEIAETVLAGGADEGLALKANQPTLYEEVADPCAPPRAWGLTDSPAAAWETWRPGSKGHGRVATRESGVLRDPAVLADLHEATPWPGLRAVGLGEAERCWADGHSERAARSYRLSRPCSARPFGTAGRRHGGIENQLHWLLALAFGEDERRVRVGESAETCAVLRRLALHLFQRVTTARGGIKAKRLKAGWSAAYLLKVLAG